MASVRPARLNDVPGIHELLAGWAARRLLLPRTPGELYDNLRDFLVVEGDGGWIVGCVALHIVNARLGEVKSLAVDAREQGKGQGRHLVEAAVAAARDLGLERVFCLTYQTDFFAKLGFVRIDRSRLPEKVWGECVRCDRFLNCDEVAMWRETTPGVG